MNKERQRLRALSACLDDVHVARVVVHAAVGLMLVLSFFLQVNYEGSTHPTSQLRKDAEKRPSTTRGLMQTC